MSLEERQPRHQPLPRQSRGGGAGRAGAGRVSAPRSPRGGSSRSASHPLRPGRRRPRPQLGPSCKVPDRAPRSGRPGPGSP